MNTASSADIAPALRALALTVSAHLELRAYAFGSNAGGGAGVLLGFVTADLASAACATLRDFGAASTIPAYSGLEGFRGRWLFAVRVPDAAAVYQRRGGPIDGPDWPGAAMLRSILSAAVGAK